MGSTSGTLIQRIRNLDDETGWNRFIQLYRPRLMAWCRQRGLSDEQADDVTQEVLTRVVRHLPRFQYCEQGNFSGWLRSVWKTAWIDYLRHHSALEKGEGGSTVQLLLQEHPGGDLSEELADSMDREYQRQLLATAVDEVRRVVSDRDWMVFDKIVFGNQAATHVSRELGMSLAAVGMIKHRIQKRLRSIIENLDRK